MASKVSSRPNSRSAGLLVVCLVGPLLLTALVFALVADTSHAVNNCPGEGPPRADICGVHLTFNMSTLTWVLLAALIGWLAVVAHLARLQSRR